jgi:four helix bundle protein
MARFERLFVWKASIEVAVTMISLSDKLVAQRRFALADQLVRAALSVPSNIAEGQGRSSTKDRRHYFVQARGSLYELETQLEIIRLAAIIEIPSVESTICKISAGLTKIIDRLATRTD